MFISLFLPAENCYQANDKFTIDGSLWGENVVPRHLKWRVPCDPNNVGLGNMQNTDKPKSVSTLLTAKAVTNNLFWIQIIALQEQFRIFLKIGRSV